MHICTSIPLARIWHQLKSLTFTKVVINIESIFWARAGQLDGVVGQQVLVDAYHGNSEREPCRCTVPKKKKKWERKGEKQKYVQADSPSNYQFYHKK